MRTTNVTIVASIAKSAAENDDGDLRSRALAAMRAARSNGIIADEDEQFQGAVVGLAAAYGEGSDEHVGYARR